MNSRTIIALLAVLFVSASAQYYAPYAGYAGYYPGSYAAYSGYVGYAAGYPSYAAAASYYPSAYSSLYYGYGSNKGSTDKNGDAQEQQPQIKLTNNQ
uniref:Uncharacterized protein n=1 Tax=Parastrongyloides trichosuri TaxID=131310 RepID=A0A0N4ZZX1_PARTI